LKVAGGRFYFYYGLLRTITEDRPVIRRIIESAMNILSAENDTICNREFPLSDFPFNIVAVDVKKQKATFSWYKGFWTDIRPRLMYSITVHVDTGKVYVKTHAYRSEGRWPWSYLHRKELFLEGLERIILDPYGNGLSLAWDPKRRKDCWVDLPWRYFKANAVVRDGTVKIYLGKEFEGKNVEVMVKVPRE